MEKRFVTIGNKTVEEIQCELCKQFAVKEKGIVTFVGNNAEKFKCWECWRLPWGADNKFTPDDLNFNYDELQIIGKALDATYHHKDDIWIKELDRTGTSRRVFHLEFGDVQAKVIRILRALEAAETASPQGDANESKENTYCS